MRKNYLFVLPLMFLFGCQSTPSYIISSSNPGSFDGLRQSLSESERKKFDTAVEIIRIRPDKIFEGDYEMMQDLEGLDYSGTISKAKSYANENISSLSMQYEKYKSDIKNLNNFKVECGQNVSSLDSLNYYSYTNNTNKDVSKCLAIIQSVNKKSGEITDRGEIDFNFDNPIKKGESNEQIGMMTSMKSISIDPNISSIKFMTKELYDEKGVKFASTDWSNDKLVALRSFKTLLKNL